MTSANPDVVVVIPLGGVDRRLGAQLAAVLGQQTDFVFEVVLAVNSAEPAVTDFVAATLREADDERIRVVDASAKRSAAFARNRGAAASRAPVIAFCDADDEVAPSWLQHLVRGVDEGQANGGMLSESRFCNPRQAKWRPPATPGELPSFMGVPYLVSANMAVARDSFERVGGFDETLVRSEDIAFGWALCRNGVALQWMPEAIVHYRHRDGVVALMRQHYLYGVGMAQVLKRHGIPEGSGGRVPQGMALLRPNGQRSSRSVMTVVRRSSVAAGRVAGLLQERRVRSTRVTEAAR